MSFQKPSEQEDPVSEVSRTILRCSAVALLVALGTGSAPGAAPAQADSASSHTASSHSKPAPDAGGSQPSTASPAGKAAPKRHAASSAAASPPRDATTTTTTTTTSKTAATPKTAVPVLREPICGACLGFEPPRPSQRPSVGGTSPTRAGTAASPVRSLSTASGRLQAAGSVVVTQAAAPVRTSPLALLEVSRPQAATLGSATLTSPRASVRLGDRIALPPQGPTSFGRLVPSAGQADVPVFVAFVGLILVLLGGRNVGRFRRGGIDEDLDLIFPTA